MKIIMIILTIMLFFTGKIVALTPMEILKKVDENKVFKTIQYTGTMKIKKTRRKPRIKTFKVVAKGKDKAYIEFTNPGDRGTKYLKLGDELWVKGVYAERAEKISGNRLRDSMMGSDYSYEDIMDNEKLINKYKAKLLGTESIKERDCYKLELTAKVKKISYPKLIIWVDKERFITMKMQYFALSGVLLKELQIKKVEKINNRYFPVKIRMENKQRENSYTIFKMSSVVLDKPIGDSFFSKSRLER